jgi:hypothetical protein
MTHRRTASGRPLSRLLAALVALAVLTAVPATSFAKAPAKVEWKRVDVPPGPSADRHTRMLKALLAQAAKKADFGDATHLVMTARLVQFTAEERGDVVRLTCTIHGRLEGGPGARSRISFGGSPAKRLELEKQVLTMVATGVVTRLAEIARTRAARDRAVRRDGS